MSGWGISLATKKGKGKDCCTHYQFLSNCCHLVVAMTYVCKHSRLFITVLIGIMVSGWFPSSMVLLCKFTHWMLESQQ